MSDDLRPLNEGGDYEWCEYKGRLTIYSECCADHFSADEELVLLRYLLAKHPQPNLLADLRAEVVKARDEASDDAFFYAEECVYDQMLDLIDEHAREGQ